MEKKDQKCFFWCHDRHINVSKKYPETIKRMIKKLAKTLPMMELSFQG